MVADLAGLDDDRKLVLQLLLLFLALDHDEVVFLDRRREPFELQQELL